MKPGILGLIILLFSSTNAAYTSIGCRIDKADDRALLLRAYDSNPDNSPATCEAACLEAYPTSNGFGLQYEFQCYCQTPEDQALGYFYDRYGSAPPESCNYTCPGNSEENCGGNYFFNAFTITSSQVETTATTPVPTTTSSPTPSPVEDSLEESLEVEEPSELGEPLEVQATATVEEIESASVVETQESIVEPAEVSTVDGSLLTSTTITVSSQEEDNSQDNTSVDPNALAVEEESTETTTQNPFQSTIVYVILGAVAVLAIAIITVKIVNLKKEMQILNHSQCYVDEV